jgi:pyruvate,water dikinase
MIAAAMGPAALHEPLHEAAYGGKAAQLAAALRAGLPVPRGVAQPVDVVAAVAAGDAAAAGEPPARSS